jgi:hypothetical protein
MKARVVVGRGRNLKAAMLTTETAGGTEDCPVVVPCGESQGLGPTAVDAVIVNSYRVPVGLLDAAVEAGFYVIGQPT